MVDDTIAPTRKSRSGSETRQRGNPKPIRFTAEELAAIEGAADRKGLAFSSYVRAAALDAAAGKAAVSLPVRSVRRPPVERELLAQALGQLGKIGSNLNQIARAANMDREERADLGTALAMLKAIGPVLMEALGRPALPSDAA